MTARAKTGGRRRGSIDREERKVITDRMAADLVFCYAKLGGRDWLLSYAEANPKEFIQFGLSRLWPAPQKSDDEPNGGDTYNTVNFNDMSDMEIGRRVAFALAKGLHAQQQLEQQSEPIDVTPQERHESMTPQEACRVPDRPLVYPEPVEASQDQTRWANELSLSPEERRANALVRDTRECTIENYHGSSAEQGGGSGLAKPQVRTKRTVNQIRRDQLL